MNKRILLILAASLSISGMAFCNAETQGFLKQIEILHSQLDSEGSGKSDTCKDFVRSNIQYLETKVRNKIERAEAKLQIYQDQLKSSEDSVEIDELMDKVAKTQKKIEKLQEVLVSLEMVKAQLDA